MKKGLEEELKEIWLLRHATKQKIEGATMVSPESGLTEIGVLKARRVARMLLNLSMAFKKVLASPLPRAYQTGTVISLMLGMGYPEILMGLAGPYLERWGEIALGLKSHGCKDFFEADPAFVKSEGERVFKEVTSIAAPMECGERVLCISHGGYIEPCAAVALGGNFDEKLLTIKDMGEGEGMIFYFNSENSFVKLKEFRLPSIDE